MTSSEPVGEADTSAVAENVGPLLADSPSVSETAGVAVRDGMNDALGFRDGVAPTPSLDVHVIDAETKGVLDAATLGDDASVAVTLGTLLVVKRGEGEAVATMVTRLEREAEETADGERVGAREFITEGAPLRLCSTDVVGDPFVDGDGARLRVDVTLTLRDAVDMTDALGGVLREPLTLADAHTVANADDARLAVAALLTLCVRTAAADVVICPLVTGLPEADARTVADAVGPRLAVVTTLVLSDGIAAADTVALTLDTGLPESDAKTVHVGDTPGVADAGALGAPLADVVERSDVDTDVVRLSVRAPLPLCDSVVETDGVRAMLPVRVDCTDCVTDGEHVATLTDEPDGHAAGQPHAVGAPTPDAQNEPAGQRNAVALHEPAGQ